MGADNPTVSAAAVQSFLTDHFDENSQKFDDYLIGRTRRHMRREARQAGEPRMNPVQLDAISQQTLMQAKNSSTVELQQQLDEDQSAVGSATAANAQAVTVGATAVGLDPATVLKIAQVVIPMLIDCVEISGLIAI